MPTPPSPAFLEHPAFGPVRALLGDPEVTEIMINGPSQVYAERGGIMQAQAEHFRDDAELMLFIRAILQPTGRDVSTASPYVDFRLGDGSRGNVVIPPVALNGPVVTIRKFTRLVTNVEDMILLGTLSKRMARLLVLAIQARANIVFSGAAGTGKTTSLGILAQYIPESERIVVIEDTAELQFTQPNVVRLECRRPNLEGRGEVTLSDLVRNSLRMRPTRIIVGEIRGDEASDMIQAISSGHHGCLAVVHGGSPEDTVSRLEMMLLSRGLLLPLWAIHRQIASTIDLVVQHEMLPDGTRKITRLTELDGVGENQVILRDLFTYRMSSGGGQWHCSGQRPRLADRCDRMGLALPEDLYADGAD